MKKYLIKICLFFLAIAVIDVLFGIACQYMNDHAKGGGIRSRYYVCKESNEDVLIFGSSRAKHHYVPDIVEDSLGISCYNTGEDGNGIILCYGFLKMITKRYSPKLIIYDVSAFDIYEDDNTKYLDLLKPYYHELGIDSVFWSVNPDSRYMMMSSLYRYNTTCLRVLGSFIHPMNNYPKGYSPLHKTMDYEPVLSEADRVKVDRLKIKFFEDFVQLSKSKNIQLVCCVSPTYNAPEDDAYYQPVKNLCSKYDVPFFYYGTMDEISNNKIYFEDRIHMNDTGARKYTKKMIEEVKQWIREKGTAKTDSLL